MTNVPFFSVNTAWPLTHGGASPSTTGDGSSCAVWVFFHFGFKHRDFPRMGSTSSFSARDCLLGMHPMSENDRAETWRSESSVLRRRAARHTGYTEVSRGRRESMWTVGVVGG